MSLPIRLTVRFVANIVVVGLMASYLDTYFQVSGGIPAYIIIGALLTLMNIFVRPILNILTLPLRLFMTIVAIILVNAGFLWLTYLIVLNMEPELVRLEIFGLAGWLIASTALGIANWLMKETIKGGGSDD